MHNPIILLLLSAHTSVSGMETSWSCSHRSAAISPLCVCVFAQGQVIFPSSLVSPRRSLTWYPWGCLSVSGLWPHMGSHQAHDATVPSHVIPYHSFGNQKSTCVLLLLVPSVVCDLIVPRPRVREQVTPGRVFVSSPGLMKKGWLGEGTVYG